MHRATVCFGWALVVSSWLSAFSVTQAQEKAAPDRDRTNAPAGRYIADAPVRIMLRLHTNGTYEATCDQDKPAVSQTGTWQWDAQRQEFRLKIKEREFSICFATVTREQARRGMPAMDSGRSMIAPVAVGGLGAKDYVRFKRQKIDAP